MSRSGAAALLLLAALGCSPDPGGGGAAGSPGAIVRLGETPDVRVRAGEETTVLLPFTVTEGYHVQANPAAHEFLVPLELHLEAGEGIELGPAVYPPGHRLRLEGTEE